MPYWNPTESIYLWKRLWKSCTPGTKNVLLRHQLLLSASWTIKTAGTCGAVLWPDKWHVRQSNRACVEHYRRYVLIFRHKQVSLRITWSLTFCGSYSLLSNFQSVPVGQQHCGATTNHSQFYCCIILTRLCFNQQIPPPPSTLKFPLSALPRAGLAFASSGKCNWITFGEGMKEM